MVQQINLQTTPETRFYENQYKQINVENTEGAIKNGQSRETGNIGYTRLRKDKAKTQHNMRRTPLYTHKHK